MDTTTVAAPERARGTSELDYEVVVIGAGMCGLYAIHLLTRMGIEATVLEAADGVGGNWYANRYPGCRFDSESFSYGYSFSPEVLEEWDWKETFAAQPEVLSYIDYVADKLDLRRHVQTGCRVERATFDPESHSWTVSVAGGREIRTRHVLTAIGLLTIPAVPPFEGRETFRGPSFHTHDWPQEKVDLAGKRVAVIGTGSSGVQVISAIAGEVAELTVYQRNPNWCAPLNNSPIDAERMAEIRCSYDEIFARCRETPGGFIHGPLSEKAMETAEEERLALWEELYAQPGFGICYANYRDTGMERDANELLSEFIAGKIRQRVDDPELAEKLIPRNHGFGTKRVILETNYYEAYNRDNVSLVDLRETPIERITEAGIVTADGEREFDVIVYATGFDAVTGAFDRIDFRGVGGASLREKWADGPVTFIGLQVHGFPNLFTLTGPQSGSGASNFPRGIEEICEWTTRLLAWAGERGYTWIEAREQAERDWLEHVRDRAGYLLLSEAKSWITGYSAGKQPPEPRHLIYLGGVPRYRRFIEAQAAEGYPGFEFR
jgi:cation diffusion facilitator CzcD-associated flavoprotein CzcO